MRIPELHDRDLIGYGAEPTAPGWPNGARLAVSFVINYEEGAEYSFPAGDEQSETYLAEVVWPTLPPGVRLLGAESLYDFGGRAGIWRLLSLFEARGMYGTVHAVGQAVEMNPEPVRALSASGWEIASHHYRWIDYGGMSESDEREHMARSFQAIEDAVGVRPVGFYGGRVSLNSRRLASELGGVLWDGDAYDDELPYWRTVNGEPWLVIPYQLDCNDFRYAMTPGWADGDQFASYLKASFDFLHAEGATCPKMLSIGLHPRLSGRPGRAAALASFLDHVQAHDDVWVCTRADIARHWRAVHGT